MKIEIIENAVDRGEPFRLRTADGAEFLVPHTDYVFVPPKTSPKRTFVIVYDDRGFASYLPLLTITSLTYRNQDEHRLPDPVG